MAAKTRVVINRAEFGRQVTASPAMGAYLTGLAQPIADDVDGTILLVTEPARAGGSRTRVHIANGSTDLEEADSNRLTTALASRLPLS